MTEKRRRPCGSAYGELRSDSGPRGFGWGDEPGEAGTRGPAGDEQPPPFSLHQRPGEGQPDAVLLARGAPGEHVLGFGQPRALVLDIDGQNLAGVSGSHRYLSPAVSCGV